MKENEKNIADNSIIEEEAFEEITPAKDRHETDTGHLSAGKKNKKDKEGKKKKKKAKKDKSVTPGQRLMKIFIILMLIVSIALVSIACFKQYFIDTKPEQSQYLPMGFVHEEQNIKKSPWENFIDFLFGKSDDDENSRDDNSSDSNGQNGVTDKNNDGTPDSLDDLDSATSVRRKDEFYNFLVIAKDKGGGNTDTMMVLSFDVPNKSISLLQIPRDTIVNYKGGVRKINAVFSSGYGSIKGSVDEKTEKGVDALSTTLLENFGIVIDRYVIIDLEGFRNIVDTIGGVDVYVQQDMVYNDEYQDLYINLKKGWNHLNGDKAEDFVRFRKGYVNADLGRMDAQKIFMSAFLKKLFSMSTVTKVPELIGHVMEYVDTDVALQEATYFGTRLLDMGMSNITMHSLQGTSDKSTYYNGASYFSPYKKANIDLVNQYFNVFNKDLGVENVNQKMLVPEAGNGKYDGGKTAEEIDENNPALSYVR